MLSLTCFLNLLCRLNYFKILTLSVWFLSPFLQPRYHACNQSCIFFNLFNNVHALISSYYYVSKQSQFSASSPYIISFLNFCYTPETSNATLAFHLRIPYQMNLRIPHHLYFTGARRSLYFGWKTSQSALYSFWKN